MVRRVLAAGLLIVLGLALLESQLGGRDGGRTVLGVVCLLVWGSAAFGVLAARPWGRLAGLALAGIGIIGGLFQFSQSGPGGQRVLLEVFFLATGPTFAWINVALAAAAFAVLSALAGALLLLPLSPREADGDVPAR